MFPNAVLLADVDLDGDLDLIVVYFSEQHVAVSLNDGSGSFAAPRFHDALGDTSFDGAVGDIDGDGFPDLLVVTKGLTSGSILRNQGDGTFAAPVAFGSDVAELFDVVPADLDGDGTLDLLVQGSDGVFALHNEGAATFAPAVLVYPVWSSTLLAADVTGDGAPDLVAGPVLLVNKGDGTFSPPIDLEMHFQPGSIAVGDVNGDGLADLAGIADGGITVLLSRTKE